MRLPSVIEVHVATAAGEPVPNALVRLNTRVLGHDYFRPFLGLTDGTGMVQATKDSVARDFAYNRRFFPMDYKVPLDDCDDEIVIGLEGEPGFQEHRAAALAATWVSAEAKAMWRQACNGALQSVSTLVALPSSGERVTVRLKADNVRPSV